MSTHPPIWLSLMSLVSFITSMLSTGPEQLIYMALGLFCYGMAKLIQHISLTANHIVAELRKNKDV